VDDLASGRSTRSIFKVCKCPRGIYVSVMVARGAKPGTPLVFVFYNNTPSENPVDYAKRVQPRVGFSFSTGFVQATIPPQQDHVLLHGRERKCQRSERAAHDRSGTETGGLDDRIVQVREWSG
jgi:hypothetical protein